MNEVYGKAVASIESVDDDKFGPYGGFTAVLSTPSEDRDGDRLARDEWLEFTQERYPLDIDHGMSVADTVGSFVPYWDGDRMMMDAHYANTPKAQETRALTSVDPVTGIRHIGAVSVAFMTDKSKKSGEPRRELLNAGIVAIPSNRDAVILASKAASALRDAFSDATEGDVPEEVKDAVMGLLDAKDGKKPYGDVRYADPADGKYPIDTVAHIRAALAYINVAHNYALLGSHAAHIKATIEAAARAHGIDVAHPHEKSAGKAGKAIFVDVIPRLDEDALKRVTEEILSKAAAPGGDAAMVQAIHDASCHLGACCAVPMVPDEDPSGAQEGANKSVEDDLIKFTAADGQFIKFASHGEASEFFADMLESIKSADEQGRTLVEVGFVEDEKSLSLEELKPEGMDMEQFKSALQECLAESVDESPETPAAPDVESAPAPVSPEDVDLATRAQMLRMQMNLRS